MLGRRFDGGVELSGGEWQKVALGRAYMRDAQVLILDEPTASLDARAEYEVFLRFAELTKGRMAVLISHRFSTVRMADRILVLQGGELVDKGTHLFGARGTPERLARLPWRMALVQVPFAILFTLLLGPKALAWFAALIVATAVYNCQQFAFKGRPGFDVLNQAGYLLVFVLASCLNHASQ